MSTDQKVLIPADHEHFLEHGYVVVREAVPADVIAAAVEVLDAGAETPEAQELVDACTTDKVHDAIGELFGPGSTFPRVRGGRDMARPHEPEGSWAVPMAHVDDAYPTIMPNGWTVGTFIFLTLVKARGGAFICFPGSPYRYRLAMARSCHSIREVAGLVEHSGDHLEYLAEPGDLLIFHHLQGHCGSPNLSDPVVTRHALLTRWHPTERIVPGRKPFGQMTTIEKANSLRFIEQRCGVDLQISEPATGKEATLLTDGLSGLGRVVSCAVLHLNGLAQFVYVEVSSPEVIRRKVSGDFLNWSDAGVVEVAVGGICSLQLHQYLLEAILAVTAESGDTVLFSTRDFNHWQKLDTVAGCATSTPWFAYAKYPTKVAAGNTLFSVSTSEPYAVVCRWGERWEESNDWETRSTAIQVSPNVKILDVTIAAQYSDSACAFVLDLQPAGAEGETAPHYVLPVDVAVAEEQLQPLPWSGTGPPRNIRVFIRARSYWMVTYLARVGDEDRMFWGCIDWSEAEPTLRQLDTAEAFDEANCIVGMI